MALFFSIVFIKRKGISDCQEKEERLSYLEMRFGKCNSYRFGIESNESFTNVNVKNRRPNHYFSWGIG